MRARAAYDLKEIQADPAAVVAHKATACGLNIIVEDTSLDVEGAAVGVNVKQMLADLGDYVGKPATWRVLLAVMVQKVDRQKGKVETVYVYEGLQEGGLLRQRSLACGRGCALCCTGGAGGRSVHQ